MARGILGGIIDDIQRALGDVSGGTSGTGTGTTGGDAAPSIDEFVTEEGGALAVAFGEHLVAGHLILHKYQDGPPPSSVFAVALGEGVWDSAVKVWYAGEELSASPDGTTPGYHFHPGTISTGIADATQGVDSFLSTGIAYSGTAYVAIKLPEKFATEDRPDKMRGRFKCKKVLQYDVNGATDGTPVYSVNPADVAIDRLRQYFLQRYKTEAEAAAALTARVDWQSYLDWWFYNNATISWNDGTTTRNISRFECHAVFTSDVDLASALDQICASAGAFWQDDGERIRFVPPNVTTIRHHFSESNIVSRSFSIAPRDVRERPNYVTASFRDTDDPYLTPAKVTVTRPELIAKVGKVYSERAFFNMTFSQAQRLLERQMRIESDNVFVCSLRGFGDSLHVLPGDYVTVSHPIPGWTYQRCLVLDASVDSAEKTADEVEFTLQAIDGDLYKDTDHKPRQAALAP